MPPAEQHAHKYEVVVDGNSVAARLQSTLCAGSLALLAELYSEWYFFRMRPYVHYLPVRCAPAGAWGRHGAVACSLQHLAAGDVRANRCCSRGRHSGRISGHVLCLQLRPCP